MVIWLSLEIFPRWCARWGFFYAREWLILCAVFGWLFCRIKSGGRIPIGTAFALVPVRLSSDLQLLVTPEPIGRHAGGVLFSVIGNISVRCQTAHR